GEVWVVGTGGYVGRRPPGPGSATSFCRPGAMADLEAVWGAASDDVWAVGDGGTVLHWDGTGWAQVAPTPTADATSATKANTDAPEPGALRGVHGDAAGAPATVWVVGDGGVARVFDGKRWQIADADARLTLSGVW